MTTEDSKVNDETQIGKIINDWAKATREGNNDAVLSNQNLVTQNQYGNIRNSRLHIWTERIYDGQQTCQRC